MKHLIKTLVTGFIWLTLSACSASKESAKSNVIYDKQTYQSLSNLESTLAQKRTPITFVDGSANSCNEYLKLHQSSTLQEAVNNFLVKSEYLECEALELLTHSKVTRNQQTASTPGFGKILSNKLDLTSFRSSLYRTTDDNHKTLSSLFPKKVTVEDNVAVLQINNRLFRLQLIAESYINDNQQADWIIYLSDEILDGNYRNYSTLIILDPVSCDKDLLEAKVFKSIAQ